MIIHNRYRIGRD